jgi:hypothetical protein
MGFRKDPPYLDPSDATIAEFGKAWDFTHSPGTTPHQVNIKLDGQWLGIMDFFAEQMGLSRSAFARWCAITTTIALGHVARNGILPEDMPMVERARDEAARAKFYRRIEFWNELRTDLKTTASHLATLDPQGEEVRDAIKDWEFRMDKMESEEAKAEVRKELGRWMG